MLNRLFRKSNFYIALAIINIAILIIIFLFYSNQFPDFSLNRKEKVHVIGADYMTMNNEFYHIISESINSRIEEEGDQFIVRDAALDSSRQIEQINYMIDRGVEALIIAPVDWTSLTNVISKAKEKGIKVIIVDTDVDDPKFVDSTITSDNYQAGQLLGSYYLSQVKASNLVLLTHESAKSAIDRVRGFLDVVETNPNIHVVSKLDCQGF